MSLPGLDFLLGEDIDALRDAVRDFAQTEIAPRAAEIDASDQFPMDLWRKMGNLGVLGVTVEEEYGGAAMGYLAHMIAMEEISRASASVGLSYGAHSNLCVNQIRRNGNAAQKAKYLKKVAAGEMITAVGITEPGAGSDVAGIRTTARKEGNQWVLNGTKMFITNGVHADLYFVAAKTGTARHDVTMFIVEKGTPGFSVGRALKKTGWLSSDTAELVFDNVRIPEENLLGEQGKGFYSVMKNFQTERIALAAMAVGHCTQALKLTLDYVRQRQAFGATLWDKQTIRQRLSMLDARTRAARQFMYHCAWSVTQGHDIVQEVSMLKALTGELVNEVVQTCQQFHGGMGFIRETAIERLWRDARVLAIGGGATEVMLEEVAKRY